MNREKLENLIKDFSLQKLADFLWDANLVGVQNFEPAYFESLDFLNSEDIFSEVEKLGEIETEDKKKIIVAAIKTANDLSERSGKKKQYDLGKRILMRQQKCDAGIFVFYDNSGSFRFSLIYPTYSGTRMILNNFRRFTYFVSSDPAVTNKTFLKRIGEGDFSSLEKIKEAFSVEKVTKEFFGEYKNLFNELVSELDNNHTFKNEAVKYNINTDNFAKKLLGQIVFLCFLQKKRWLGAPQNKLLKHGDENFLQNLFNGKYIKYNNFFNDILEHLFYGALNKKSDKAGTFYRSYLNCQIPFLNGGLFESEYRWEETRIYLDNKIFERILEVFNRYNFTVDENSPIDQEIAIDPEMLGKVFENLLSENLRKGKGTYYTPREIVHYMCQESLINYLAAKSQISEDLIRKLITQQDILSDKELENLSNAPEQLEQAAGKNVFFDKTQARLLDKLLQELKVVDPACGSGAFLVGMLHEIIKARLYLDQWHLGKNVTGYDLKKETIQNCVYGVDIDPGAIEIAKLRLWLSLVVDYELEEIEPLPNLDYKIMQGNSLLEELVLGDTNIKLFDQEQNKAQATLLENEEQASVDKLNSLHKKYFALNDLEEKKKVKKEIDDIEYEVIKKSVEKEVKKLEQDNKKFEFVTMGGMKKKDAESFAKNLSKQGQIMNVLNEFKKSKTKPFFLWKLNFADVFEDGGFDIVIANPPYINIEKLDKNTKEYIFDQYKTCAGRTDIYIAFIEKSFSIIKDNSFTSFIVPHSFVNQKYGTNLRQLLVNQYHIDEILDTSNYFVFNDVVVKNIVLFSSKRKIEKPTIIKIARSQTDFLKNKFETHHIFQNKFLKMKDSRFETKNIAGLEDIKAKLWNDCLRFENICFIAYGARLNHKNKNISKDNYISKEKTDKYDKPYIEGKNIQRYKITQFGWLFYNPKEHYNPMFNGLFENNKIVFINVVKDELRFAFDTNGFYDSHTVVNCVKWNLLEKCDHISIKRNINREKIKNGERFDYRFLLGLLNSNLICWYFKMFLSEQLHFYPDDAKSIPIKNTLLCDQKPFINLVDQILKKKKDNPNADTGELEREIDQMVYELYNLAEEEIRVVENSDKK